MSEEMQSNDLSSEAYCHLCHGPNVIWSAPSPLWNQVMRGGDINARDLHDGIICPTCFMTLAEEAGIAHFWRVTAEVVNVDLPLITPSGRVWDEKGWRWREPGEMPWVNVLP